MTYFNLEKEGITEPQANAVSSIDTQQEPTSILAIEAPRLEELQFKISEFNNRLDNVPKKRIHTWASFCDEFRKHPIRREKDGLAWSPVNYVEGGTRRNEFVDHVYFAVVDVDDGTSHENVLK